MTVELRGLTWDHPRAYQPLEAIEAAGLVPGVRVVWNRQSLAGFESEPIAELARRYDLLVIDHPGLGAAVRQQALLPVEDVFAPDDLERWRAGSIGSTWDSYQLDGHGWALPLDAATQACLVRPDLLAAPPATWADAADLARSAGVALCLAGPHAGLMLLALAGDRTRLSLLDRDRAVEALVVLRRIWQSADQQASLLDPIELHDLLSSGDDIVCCPLVYSYAVYGAPGLGRHQLGWFSPPRLRSTDEAPGSTLGGTGLAVSPRAYDRVLSVSAYVRRLLDPVIQVEVVAPAGGQPAAVQAWRSEVVDRQFNGHYSATLDTVGTAYVRPRHDGWIPFQDELSERGREALRTDDDPAAVI
ncbi:MAG: hypothetical protein ACRDPR_10350, partial [Nocardioidaceae bacterium]